MASSWDPLSVRRGLRDGEPFQVLYEGVPSWIRHQLREWVEEWLSQDPDSLALAQTVLRLEDLGWGSGGLGGAWSNFQTKFLRDDDLFLDVLDLILRLLVRADSDVRELETWLSLGGSAWTVAFREDEYRLERRVDDTVALAANELIAGAGRAGTHLAKAWKEIYGRDPDSSASYRESVRAVEVAAIAVVSPNNQRATLGTVIGEMRADSSRWDVTINAPNSFDALLGMMNLLWKGQGDRHGTPDSTAPLNVSMSEAEVALHLAVTLVHWFDRGFARRV